MSRMAIHAMGLFLGMLGIESAAQVPTAVQLTASTINADQDFGFSVDLDGEYAVVGAFRDEDGIILETGAAFVYHYNGATWEETAKLEASSINSLNWFGWDVATDGDIVLASARRGDTFTTNGGDVTVFRLDGSNWVEEAILTPSDAVIGDFGFAVEVDGNVAAVGAPGRSGTVGSEGAVYVYRYNGVQWVEEDILLGSNLSVQSLFGSAIAIDGDRMLVSAFNADDSTSNQAGKLFIFDYDGAQWNRTIELQSNNSNNIANLGVSVALDGDWAVGGAPLDDTIQGGAGAALVYQYDGSNWNFHSKLTASDGAGFFLFGSAVAISGNRLVVTADNWFPSGGVATGKAYLFEYNEISDVWEEVESFVPAGVTQGASFGHAAAMQGDVMLFGAPEYDGTEDAMGAAYVYGVPMVATSNEKEVPETTFLIGDLYPNPFNHTATLTLTPDTEQKISILMYDMLGREVRRLFEGQLPASPSNIDINAVDLPNGIYWLKIETSQGITTRSIILQR